MQFSPKNISRRWAMGLLASCLTFAAVSHAALSSIGDGEAAFRAAGPMGLKIDGETKDVSVSEAGGVITVTVGVKNLKTGITMRDDHMKKAIHADKHPNVLLQVKRSDLKFPEDQKQVRTTATGKFILNGKSQDLTFEYIVKRTGSDYHVAAVSGPAAEAKAAQRGFDYTKHIEEQCYLGQCVDPQVFIRTKFKLREK